MPNEFLLKSVVFKLISKEISRAEHEYMNIPPPPPINALATAGPDLEWQRVAICIEKYNAINIIQWNLIAAPMSQMKAIQVV